MRENTVEVLEPEVVPTAPAPPNQARIGNRANGNKRQNATLSRHATKCRICNHPDRAAIEFDFLNWRNPGDIVKAYHFRDLSTIYRHAHATGLFSKRRLNLRFALERIVERVAEVPVTANAVIRAARAVSRINDAGEWVDPPSRLIVTHLNSEEPPEPQARAGKEAFVGRGFNRDIKRRSSKPSFRARQGDEGKVPSITAHDGSGTKSRPSLIFDDALLDEPSESAANSGELPKLNGKPPEPEVILTITPEFARCREERQRAIEADLAARAAANAVTETQSMAPSSSSVPQAELPNSAPPALNDPTRQTQTVPSQSSSLPEAAFAKPVPASTAPSPARESRGEVEGQSVALSPSSLPQAASKTPATACPEQGRGASQSPRAVGPPLGSSGSADPPFPFTPEPLRRWKSRRRF